MFCFNPYYFGVRSWNACVCEQDVKTHICFGSTHHVKMKVLIYSSDINYETLRFETESSLDTAQTTHWWAENDLIQALWERFVVLT